MNGYLKLVLSEHPRPSLERESDRCVPPGVFNQSYYIVIFQEGQKGVFRAENKVTLNNAEIATTLLDLLIFLCILVVSTEIENIRSQKCSVPCIVSAMFRGTSLVVPLFDSRLEVLSMHSLHH